jgi:hypothetical protein
MFNCKLKKEALNLHEKTVQQYNAAYKSMQTSCESLMDLRNAAVELITESEVLISSIANTPKEFEKNLGEIRQAIQTFRKTEAYIEEQYQSSVKAGIGVLSGAAAGGAFAALSPKAAMSIAMAFGKASTGRAISALSGAAAQKAALAWLGRGSAKIAGKAVVGAGMVQGQAFLALAGPLGWGISAVSTGVSLAAMTKKNKDISNNAINEAKKIMEARGQLEEIERIVSHLKQQTSSLISAVERQLEVTRKYRHANYADLLNDVKLSLGTLVNETRALSASLNKAIE